MNWEALGAIGETLGAVAVFVTLVYLAVQVRHARREGQRALSQGRSDGIRQLFVLGTDERVSQAMVKGNAGLGVTPGSFPSMLIERAGLTREEAQVAFYYQVAWWDYTVQIISNIDDLRGIERRQFEVSVINRYGRPGIAGMYYQFLRDADQVHPDALSYIDGVLAKAA